MPSSSSVHVDLTGAQIIDPPSPNQEREIYLPKVCIQYNSLSSKGQVTILQHVELISHIAIDVSYDNSCTHVRLKGLSDWRFSRKNCVL